MQFLFRAPFCRKPPLPLRGTGVDFSWHPWRHLRVRYRSPRAGTLNGENKIQHKLADAQVDRIRRRYAAEKISQKALAVDFGVSQQLISHLVRGTRRAIPTRIKP